MTHKNAFKYFFRPQDDVTKGFHVPDQGSAWRH